MSPTRGFVTIATGNLRYFRLARNLLYSYRHCSVSLRHHHKPRKRDHR